MTENPHIAHLIECIDLEIQEQEKRYQFDENSGLKQLKAMGVVLHPLSITRKTFGYADYPEISFRLPYLSDTSNFRDNSAIECFIDGEESVKGVLLRMDGQKGEFRLFAPDFPDWIEDKRVGIKLAPDHFTSETMKKAVKNITAQKEVEMLFECIHGKASFGIKSGANVTIDFQNKTLNESQQLAVKELFTTIT